MKRIVSKRTVAIAVVLLLTAVVISIIFAAMYSPPGSLKHPWLINRANRSDAGETVTLSFSDALKEKQYKSPYADEDHLDTVTFVYVYNSETQAGRLALSSLVSDDMSVCTITIYEPDWKSGEGLVGALADKFNAKIIDRVNVDFMEGEVYLANAASCFSDPNIPEIIDPADLNLPEDVGIQYYLGVLSYSGGTEEYWTDLGDGVYVSLKGGSLENCSESFTDDVNVFLRIVERFGLEKEFCLE